MREKYRSLLIILLGAALILTAACSKPAEPELAMASFESLFELPAEEYDREEAQKIVDNVLRIDAHLLSALMHCGGRVRLITTNVTGDPACAHLKGTYAEGWGGVVWDVVPGCCYGRIALVRIGFSDRGHGHGCANLELHEIGHAMDAYVLRHASSDGRFIEIKTEEKKKLFGAAYFNDSCEYFAEVFALYYLSDKTRDRLKEYAPLTHAYLEDAIERAKGEGG